MENQSEYPANPREWIIFFEKTIGLTEGDGKAALQKGSFPMDGLARAIRAEFENKEGFDSSFVPIVLNNKRGLVNWVYGNGSEPYWPGKDEEKPS